jgi:hypothetical protein
MGRLPTWAQLSIIALAVLLSPALALSMAIAVEIVIGLLVDAGAPALPAFVASCAVGWLLLRKLWHGQGGNRDVNQRGNAPPRPSLAAAVTERGAERVQA